MRGWIALFALGLVACRLDVSAIGDAGGASETARGDSSEGGTSSTSGSSSSSGGSSSSGAVVDEGSSSSGASTSAGSSNDSTTGEVPTAWCGDERELAACYDFTGVGSGTLLDLSGNGNDGTAADVGVVGGPFGDAATFDADSEIVVPDSRSLDIAGSLTIEAWMRVEGLPSDERMGVLDNDGQYSLIIYASDEYRCSFGNLVLFVGPVVLGEWTHVACVYDGATLRAYVNGSEQDVLVASQVLPTSNTEPMSIGDTSPDFEEPLRGAIGGVRVWSRALDPTELCEAAGPSCSG